ncbi:MAG: hypothetical protein ACFE9Z_08730 [Promethearchaeota archaeon]
MKKHNNSRTRKSANRLLLFGFELSHTQRSLFLVLSVIGILYLPFTFLTVFVDLFQDLCITLPFYFSSMFPESRRTPLWFHFIFTPHIIRIIVSSIFLYLSIHTLKKILYASEMDNNNRIKINQNQRFVNWFGFKLPQGQSLFVLTISIVGIIFTIQNLIDYSASLYAPFSYLLVDISSIPIGPNLTTSNIILRNLLPIIFNLIVLLLSIYSLIKMRRGKLVSNPKYIRKNYSLILFISSFIIFLIFLLRSVCHLILFTNFSYLLGIIPYTPNSYQIIDLVVVIIMLIFSSILMISSYFAIDNSNDKNNINYRLTWFHMEISPKKAIFILSLSTVYIIFFSDILLKLIFMFSSNNYYESGVLIIIATFLIITVFCFYSIGKILKGERLHYCINSLNKSGEVRSKWFKFDLNRSNSLFFLSTGFGFIFIYAFSIMSMNLLSQIFLSDFYFQLDWYYIILIPVSLVVLCTILFIIIYTIKQTIHSLKLT